MYQVLKFLSKNNFNKFNDIIITVYRAYFSYAFINLLKSKGFKYISKLKKLHFYISM